MTNKAHWCGYVLFMLILILISRIILLISRLFLFFLFKLVYIVCTICDNIFKHFNINLWIFKVFQANGTLLIILRKRHILQIVWNSIQLTNLLKQAPIRLQYIPSIGIHILRYNTRFQLRIKLQTMCVELLYGAMSQQ